MVLLGVAVFVMGLTSVAGATEPKGRFALSAEGGIAKITGDIGDFFKMGFGGGLAAEYFIVDNLSLGGSFQYNSFKFKLTDEEKARKQEVEEEIDMLDVEIAQTPESVYKEYLKQQVATLKAELKGLEASFKLKSITLQGKYYLPTEGKFVPYLMWGLGEYTASNGDSETKMGIHLGMGGKYSRSEQVGFIVEGAYHIVFTEEESIKYFDLKAGLIFYLGGK